MPPLRFAHILVIAAYCPSLTAQPLPLPELPNRGIGCHAGSTDGNIELAMASNGMSIVHGLALDDAAASCSRAAIRAGGCHGPVSIGRVDSLAHLPYADSLLNLLVADLDRLADKAPTRVEIMRVLAPGGIAMLRTAGQWNVSMKSRPEGMDDWPYRRHGMDGNAVSSDSIVGIPDSIRWVAGPLIGSGPAAVTAGGRLFAVFGPEKDFGKESALETGEGELVARDAFNGTPLWVGKGNVRLLFVDGGRLYTIVDGHPAALDPATGTVEQSYEFIDGNHVLSGTLLIRNRLILPMTDAVRCIDAATGEPVWRRRHTDGWELRPEFDGYRGMNHVVIVSSTNALYFVEARKRSRKQFALVSIDAATGRELFRHELNTYDETVPESRFLRTLDAGVLRVALVHGGVVAVTGRGGLQVMDAANGIRLWEYPYRSSQKMGNYYGNCFHVGGLLWVGALRVPAVGPLALEPGPQQSTRSPADGTVELFFRNHSHPARPPGRPSGQRLFSGWLGRDPRTGRTVKGLPYGRMLGSRCAPDVATEHFFLHTHMHATELETGDFHRFTAFRQNCVLGPIIGNGLTYVFPNSCMCFRMMRGTAGLAHAGDAGPHAAITERGPAYGETDGATTGSGTWPMYRANPRRTANASCELPDELELLWERSLQPSRTAQVRFADWLNKEAGNWSIVTPPVVGDHLAAAGVPGDHSVVALNATDGKEAWRFTAGGRIPASPTLLKGLCLFASSDGSVYALRMSDGAPAWRYRPGGRRTVAVYGQLESDSPAQGGVLIAEDGYAYVIVGRHTGLNPGVSVLVLSPETGELVAEHPVPGPGVNTDKVNTYSFHADWLSSDGESVRIGDIAIGQIQSALPAGTVQLPFVGAKSYAFIRSRAPADLGHPAELMSIAAGRPVTLIAGKRSGLYTVNPGETARRLVGLGRTRPSSMFVAGRRVYIATDARITAYDTADWKEVAEYDLAQADGAPVAPVFDGFAVAHSRLYISCSDGTLKCFGAKQIRAAGRD